MPIDDGAPGTLFTLNFKINTQDHGFNEKWRLSGTNYAAALTKAGVLAAARRRIMPADCSIFYATVSKDDSKRDSKFIPGALGAGLFINTGSTPPPTTVNDDRTAIEIRFENENGGSNTMLLIAVPDGVVAANALTTPPAAVTSTFAGADTVPADLTAFDAQLNYFMQMVTKYAINVQSGHAPGGNYTYWPYTAAYYVGIGKKKGGSLFS